MCVAFLAPDPKDNKETDKKEEKKERFNAKALAKVRVRETLVDECELFQGEQCSVIQLLVRQEFDSYVSQGPSFIRVLQEGQIF